MYVPRLHLKLKLNTLAPQPDVTPHAVFTIKDSVPNTTPNYAPPERLLRNHVPNLLGDTVDLFNTSH